MMPGDRYWMTHHNGVIVDGHRLPKGWNASTPAERQAAIVYEADYKRSLWLILNEFNSGVREK